jgi:hypothetical protein
LKRCCHQTNINIKFKKNDYIVILEGKLGNTNTSFLINYCYNQRQDDIYVSPFLDSNNNTENRFFAVTYDNKNHNEYTGKMNTWRYATQGEIDAYNLAGKPINITEIVIKNKENICLSLDYLVPLLDKYGIK